jgi:hypothetical protein
MEPMNLWCFYAVGGNLRKLGGVKDATDLSAAISVLTDAIGAIDYLLNHEQTIKLSHCRFSGNDLLAHINHIVRELAHPNQCLVSEGSRIIRGDLASELDTKLATFEAVFKSELPFLHAYCVSDKGILSTPKLVNKAEEMFGERTASRLPSVAIEDVRSAGRCLAFNLPTASGFHIIRALEAIVVDYIIKVTGEKPIKRDLGAYIKTLENLDEPASKDVTSVIDQIRRLHRNPLMHPEDVLEPDEALDLFLLCRSAINATVSDMDKRGLFGLPGNLAAAANYLSVSK